MARRNVIQRNAFYSLPMFQSVQIATHLSGLEFTFIQTRKNINNASRHPFRQADRNEPS